MFAITQYLNSQTNHVVLTLALPAIVQQEPSEGPSSTFTPPSVAMTIALAIPKKRPCSTTPTTDAISVAAKLGSAIGSLDRASVRERATGAGSDGQGNGFAVVTGSTLSPVILGRQEACFQPCQWQYDPSHLHQQNAISCYLFLFIYFSFSSPEFRGFSPLFPRVASIPSLYVCTISANS